VAAVLENRLLVALLSALLAVGSASLTNAVLQHQAQVSAATGGASACHLANGIGHVVNLQFENLDLSRDSATVPSDLEQMPHLLDFLEANGTVLGANHAALASLTGGVLTSLTGLYPDRHGQAIGDGWRYYRADGSTGAASTSAYWNSRVQDSRAAAPADSAYNLVTSGGRNLPAPWVAFTRAGCDVGSVAGPAGMVLQNTAADVANVFGPDSREAAEARGQSTRAAADLLGLAIHCARPSPVCARDRGGRPDRLPDEPGGYEGFNALYGQRYVGPAISGSGQLIDLEGRRIEGFGGFQAMTPAVSLGYVAAMQEHGVPVTYAYITDVHGTRGDGSALGPGEPGYVRRLQDYDRAFSEFLARLGRAGLNPANTLFVLSAEEGDHFVGGRPTPPGCDGIRTPCQYQQTGAVRVNLPGLLAEHSVSTSFAMHDDSDPAIWIAGDPKQAAPETRALERATAQLLVQDPYTAGRRPLVHYLADRGEMRLLHMVTADPARTPSFVLFSHPDFFVSGGPAACGAGGCASVDPQTAYSHGGADPEVTTTWLGLAGPGVNRHRRDGSTWADEADIRPTLLALVGLQDRYTHDGRVLSEALEPEALPAGIGASQVAYEGVAGRLKQIDAPAGRLAMLSLPVATRALASTSAADADYRSYLVRVEGFAGRRDAAAESMSSALEEAAFAGRPLDPRRASTMMESADELLAEMARA
jgi:hypothetical protein